MKSGIKALAREIKMRVGVPKEIKVQEYRVGLTPGAVREYVAAGHQVTIHFARGWLRRHPLTDADLEQEQLWLRAAGFRLRRV